MAVGIASLIDQAKLVSNNRRNAAISDADWLVFVNWAVESWWKFRTALDPGLYFGQVDFALAGGAAASALEMAGNLFTVRLASAASLPSAIPAGAGVGATLTGAANGALSVDGTAVIAGDRILIRAGHVFVAPAYNGIWAVTQAGNGGAPFILTRATDYDQLLTAEMAVGARVSVTAGATLAGTSWYLSALSGSPDVVGMVQTYAQGAGLGIRALHGVDANPDSGSRFTLRSRNFRQRNQGVGWWIPTVWCPVRFYDVRAFQLAITPYESAAGAYRLYYRGAPYKFTGTGDTTPLDAVLEPEVEAIVKLAACNADGIEESNAEDSRVKRINVIKAEVQASYERDDGQAFQIADVEDLGNGPGGWF